MYSGWLLKLSSNNAFCSARWQRRYFVLLDSELRYYKHEHTTEASKIISLREVHKVTIITENPQHPHLLQLEPINGKKYWLLSCQSELELNNWVDAINTRLFQFNTKFSKRTSPSTISRRRGVILSSIDLEEIQPMLDSDYLSSTSSTSFILPSPDQEHFIANKAIAQHAYVMDASIIPFSVYKETLINH